jgi:nucleoside-diphosphate-sugar epimerase
MSTIFVAGAGGYIGSVLIEALLDAGHRVRAFDRFFFRTALLADLETRPGLEVLRGDSRSVQASVFEGVDVAMDLAGISNDPSCDLNESITTDVNINGAQHLATTAKKAGVPRYIYSSSCSVYGQGGTDVASEDSATNPVSLYAKSKVAAEQALLSLADQAFSPTILRNATIYGLSRRMRFDLVINLMTLYAYKNRRIHVMGGGKQWRPLVHVSDASLAFITVMEAPLDRVAGQTFNVGSNEQNYQVYQIAQMVRDVVPHTDLEVVPDDPDRRSYRVEFSKIAGVLDYKVRKTPYEGIVEIKQALERGKVEDTIATRTVEYYRYLIEAEQLLHEVSLQGKIF